MGDGMGTRTINVWGRGRASGAGVVRWSRREVHGRQGRLGQGWTSKYSSTGAQEHTLAYCDWPCTTRQSGELATNSRKRFSAGSSCANELRVERSTARTRRHRHATAALHTLAYSYCHSNSVSNYTTPRDVTHETQSNAGTRYSVFSKHSTRRMRSLVLCLSDRVSLGRSGGYE